MENGGTWSKEHLQIGPMRVACGNKAAQLATKELQKVTCDKCKASKYFKSREKMRDAK